MRAFISKLILAVNIVAGLLLLSSYLSAHVSPAHVWLFAFMGTAYPVLLIVNILFVVFWIVFSKWYFLFSLVIVLAGLKPMGSYLQFGNNEEEPGDWGKTFKLLTYNVRLFNYYQWDNDTSARDKIIAYIIEEDPDIVCFQEFITVPGTSYDFRQIREKLKSLPYYHVNYTSEVPGSLSFGMATFSKFPIVNKGTIDFPGTLNGSIYSDLRINGDTVRIYNCHLQSVKLRRNYDDLLDSLIFNYDQKHLVELKDISMRMKQAFIQRAEQVDVLSSEISTSGYPKIVCGDFNDTPLSYTYHKMAKDMDDAFKKAGAGFGTTYRGFPHMRIDYILYSDYFNALDFKINRVNWSDHYPVVSRFMTGQKADSVNLHSRL